MTVEQANKYAAEGHFAPGSMLPKVEAACSFAAGREGRKAIVASLEKAILALEGKSGTAITRYKQDHNAKSGGIPAAF
jgi:carbamate kinase